MTAQPLISATAIDGSIRSSRGLCRGSTRPGGADRRDQLGRSMGSVARPVLMPLAAEHRVFRPACV